MCFQDNLRYNSRSARRRYCKNFHQPNIMRFEPNWEEFKNFEEYIATIEKLGAHHAGICIIQPPKEYNPRNDVPIELLMKNYKFKAIQQQVLGQNGNYTIHRCEVQNKKGKQQGNPPPTNKFSRDTYKKLVNEKKRAPPDVSMRELERRFWRNLKTKKSPVKFPYYGTDVKGTLMDKDLQHWNLDNLQTILDALCLDDKPGIEGVNSSYLYFGSWGSAFPWHTEDSDLYSVNYLHEGEPKVWYAIPTKYAQKLHDLAQERSPNPKKCQAVLRHKHCFFSPALLKRNGITCNKVIQKPGEIVITFPLGFHAGFNAGYNLAQAVNFATPRWIPYGENAILCKCAWTKKQIKNNEADLQTDIDVQKIKDYAYNDQQTAQTSPSVSDSNVGEETTSSSSSSSLTPSISSSSLSYEDISEPIPLSDETQNSAPSSSPTPSSTTFFLHCDSPSAIDLDKSSPSQDSSNMGGLPVLSQTNHNDRDFEDIQEPDDTSHDDDDDDDECMNIGTTVPDKSMIFNLAEKIQLSRQQQKIINAQHEIIKIYKFREEKAYISQNVSNKPSLEPNNPSDQTTFDCEECGKKYPTKRSLNKHNQYKHSGNVYVCDICGQILSNRDNLRRHILLRHCK